MAFEHAVLAVDFSPATDPLLSCLPELMQFGVQTVTLVYVLDVHYPHAPETEHLPHYEQRLRQAAEAIEAQGLTTGTEIRIGDPAAEILSVAREIEASLLVMGSHGHGLLGEALLGSVAAAVTRWATLPVLILPLEVIIKEGKHRCSLTRARLLEHLLYPTDFSDAAQHAFITVKQLSGRVSMITLLHVKEESLDDDDSHAGRAVLEQLVAGLAESGSAGVEVRMEHGSPGETIMRVAREESVSLIIMSSRGEGVIKEHFRGSVSHYVLHHADIPLLLIPAI